MFPILHTMENTTSCMVELLSHNGPIDHEYIPRFVPGRPPFLLLTVSQIFIREKTSTANTKGAQSCILFAGFSDSLWRADQLELFCI